MSLIAHLRTADEGAQDRRSGPRRRIVLGSVALRGDSPEEARPVTIHNISSQGLLLESGAPLGVGETVALELPEAGERAVEIVWKSGRLYGGRFAEPLTEAALSAAELASAVGDGLEREDGAPGEAFAARLKRLRGERKMSLARVADALGVSKPTVWAWEQGRAKPAEERLDALAELLGVDRESLLSGRDADALAQALTFSRETIAQAYGISPGQVRILIEL